MIWSLLYTLTRHAVGLATLRLRGEPAKDIELMVLRHEVMVLRRRALPAGASAGGPDGRSVAWWPAAGATRVGGKAAPRSGANGVS